MAKKKAKRKTATKTRARKRRKGTVNAYARRTKEDLAENGPSPHTNGFDLTDQQMLFVEKYLCAAKLNATNAAIQAGYSKKSAHSQASTLMANPKVKKYLRKRMDDRRRRVEVSQDKIVAEMAALAFAKPSEFVSLKGGVLTVKDLDDIPEAVQGAIKSIEPVATKQGVMLKIKFYDKVAAAKLLAQHLGMLQENGRESNRGMIVEMMDKLHAEAKAREPT